MSKDTQLVILSGASSGIGLAMARRLLEEGYQVIGISKDANEKSLNHESFMPRQIDLSDIDSLPKAMDDLVKEVDQLGLPVKALINNAGLGKMAFLEQLSVADLRLVMDVNFMSHAIITKSFLPLLKKQGSGDIVFTGSEAALKGSRQGSIYCASKFAIRGFAQALRDECGKSGVRVSILNPGAVRTPFFDELNFEPGADPENAVEADDVAAALMTVIEARPGTVLEEISISPQSHVWQRKK
ncbi:MAG: SDR family NAD(P)-dependent oxidoreductase [Gammaproteobacteria bacterium]|jgi:NADP-dependent 3-hydroxy acid dehydrogenase YdfG|nr:SDR family NAD(P)-dependent oxidoreductase [Gammaproteobacteria bacterium]MBT3859630.1 SDR family NAD(P)-dependent oxidoreductase [Gammaproteobacteria bacterium]MBT3986476.1 SDR family NAD(P)-dependent oxidoreductase [Gammaproteobacteria bacterium]MBT4256787.1 SDR family NAD(P)-dependent oxidoreductase [Gammaproteobacteria bacterium]MBT4582163.1 SDR family NAD(P)-dependent oxidoreductase [Gammaproteobacteria bacterium]